MATKNPRERESVLVSKREKDWVLSWISVMGFGVRKMKSDKVGEFWVCLCVMWAILYWVLWVWLWFVFGFDMGGCFPCFGSSNSEGSDVKEVTKKDSIKDGSTQSHHVSRVSSGKFVVLDSFCFLFSFLGCLVSFDNWVSFSFLSFFSVEFLSFVFGNGWMFWWWVGVRICCHFDLMHLWLLSLVC